uniref:Ig-like domain-containing protein n=1 Tax=Malurus cyaneus samueli TaxID=2593467 RepID=A0A8C5TFS0_9PASS
PKLYPLIHHSLLLSLTNADVGVAFCILQKPEKALQRAGSSVTISCRQNCNRGNHMFFYQQHPRNDLKLIVSITTWKDKSYEDGYSEAKLEVHRENMSYALMTIKNLTAKDEATYLCALQNSVNNEKMFFGSGTKLTVIGKSEIIPPTVAIFSPSKQELQEKSKATLVCLASGFYPDHLTLGWMVNGVKRSEGVGTDESSTRNGSTFSLTSRLLCTHRRYVCLLT